MVERAAAPKRTQRAPLTPQRRCYTCFHRRTVKRDLRPRRGQPQSTHACVMVAWVRCHSMPCDAMPCNVVHMLCRAMRCSVEECVMSCHAMPCHAGPYGAMLCGVVAINAICHAMAHAHQHASQLSERSAMDGRVNPHQQP
eukprot:322783-Chlamydomonas_euryale.AAC.8